MSDLQRRAPVPAPRQADEFAEATRDLVVVAVDGSEASVRAMVWALRHAASLGLRVEALTAWPLHGPVFLKEVTGHFSEPRWRAREAQAEAVSRALAAVDDAPPYDLRVVNAELVEALTRVATKAVLVVAGSDRADQGSGPVRLTDRLRRALGDLLVVVGPPGPAGAGGAGEATKPAEPGDAASTGPVRGGLSGPRGPR